MSLYSGLQIAATAWRSSRHPTLTTQAPKGVSGALQSIVAKSQFSRKVAHLANADEGCMCIMTNEVLVKYNRLEEVQDLCILTRELLG
jgi:hypothetical protein